MISFTWNHLNGDSLEFGLRGLNSTMEKHSFLCGNKQFAELDYLIQNKNFINKSVWSENDWWYRGCSVMVTVDELPNYVDSLAELFVALFNKLKDSN